MSQLLTNKEKDLFDKIKNEALIYDEEGSIKLSSGETTNCYFDIKLLTGDSEGINLVAKVFLERIKKIGNIRSVGGKEAGSIPIATAISMLSYSENPNSAIHSFFIRKEPKKHGMRRRLEGKADSPVIVVDDVVTTGTSALDALNYLREEKIDVNCILTVVFRGTEEEALNFKKQHGIELQYLFLQEDFTKN